MSSANYYELKAMLSRSSRESIVMRLALPQELAEAILFMSSPASSYITGTALAVDGGRTFH